MTRQPSQHSFDTLSTSSPLENNHTATVTPITSLDPLYSHIFHYVKDILEELTTTDFPWNMLHHRALFLSQEFFHPPNRYPQALVIFQNISQHSRQITNSFNANEVSLWAHHPYIGLFFQLPHSVTSAQSLCFLIRL
jgi:hypothetical protein